ncbi:MAG: hypothetical protein J6Y29_00695 [Clostridiales bacterium]|nr:hypothetical protein [Clostridiales bacterium]
MADINNEKNMLMNRVKNLQDNMKPDEYRAWGLTLDELKQDIMMAKDQKDIKKLAKRMETYEEVFGEEKAIDIDDLMSMGQELSRTNSMSSVLSNESDKTLVNEENKGQKKNSLKKMLSGIKRSMEKTKSITKLNKESINVKESKLMEVDKFKLFGKKDSKKVDKSGERVM